jgi:hypothetical protein
MRIKVRPGSFFFYQLIIRLVKITCRATAVARTEHSAE